MPNLLEVEQSPESLWRAIVLFGLNTASYKFALARELIDVSTEGEPLIPLERLADPFSRHLVGHLAKAPRQGSSPSSRFLEVCRKSAAGELAKDELISATAKLGFVNVIDAFHVVNQAEVPLRFFVVERRSATPAIRLTDEFLRMREGFQFANLPAEVEARWRLVETAWSLGLPTRR